jgi:hypothetical protein
MGLFRIRIVGLAAFTLSVQLATFGSALSAACCATDPHATSDSLTCNMPHEPGATCPMHHAPHPSKRHSHDSTDSGLREPLLACHCSALSSVVALLGTVGIISPVDGSQNPLTPIGDVAVNDTTPRHLAPQVSSPPPRS